MNLFLTFSELLKLTSPVLIVSRKLLKCANLILILLVKKYATNLSIAVVYPGFHFEGPAFRGIWGVWNTSEGVGYPRGPLLVNFKIYFVSRSILITGELIN